MADYFHDNYTTIIPVGMPCQTAAECVAGKIGDGDSLFFLLVLRKQPNRVEASR